MTVAGSDLGLNTREDLIVHFCQGEGQTVNQGTGLHRPSILSGLRWLATDPRQLWPLLNARLRLRGATVAPRSVRLWGRVRLDGGGEVVLGERVRIAGATVRTELIAQPGGRIEIGAGTFLNYGTSISAHGLVSIGCECQIGQYAIINDNDYHTIEDKRLTPSAQPVVIEDRVWLGARVIVTKGVRIGHDAVIGAGSVVTRDVPPRCVAAGVPARVLRRF